MAKAGRQPETTAPPPAARPGVYAVCLHPCPREVIDTGLPAGPAAEAVAAEKYLTRYGLVPRPNRAPQVELAG